MLIQLQLRSVSPYVCRLAGNASSYFFFLPFSDYFCLSVINTCKYLHVQYILSTVFTCIHSSFFAWTLVSWSKHYIHALLTWQHVSYLLGGHIHIYRHKKGLLTHLTFLLPTRTSFYKLKLIDSKIFQNIYLNWVRNR